MNKNLLTDNTLTPLPAQPQTVAQPPIVPQTIAQPPAIPQTRSRILGSEMDRLLLLSMLFSCLLTAARILHTERRTFIFLPWNLFLAYIPYFISTYLTRLTRRGPGWWTLSLLWLLFIPNSFYIITDLYHLGDLYNDRQMPQWFDLAMILSYVWNGLLLGVLSVRQMERLLLPRLTLSNELLFLYPVMWMNALGIYIGRYLRFNSWDIVTDPFRLLRLRRRSKGSRG